MMRAAEGHIKCCVELYRIQMSEHRYFLHEHPCPATSWRMPETVALASEFQVDIATCDMCAYGMKITDEDGESLVEKKTKVMSNSDEILKRLERKCTNKDGITEKHRHADTTGGEIKLCQVYPGQFCRAVCEGVTAQKKLDDLGLVSMPIINIEEVNEAVSHLGDPGKELHESDLWADVGRTTT